jgi:hypothetical protein
MNRAYLEGVEVLVQVLEGILAELGSTELIDDEDWYAPRSCEVDLEGNLGSRDLTFAFDGPPFITAISLGLRTIFWNRPKSHAESLGQLHCLLFAEIMAEFIAPQTSVRDDLGEVVARVGTHQALDLVVGFPDDPLRMTAAY